MFLIGGNAMRFIFILISFIFLLSIFIRSQPIEDPLYTAPTLSPQTSTNFNYPEPKHVLVVYKNKDSQSDSIGIISEDVKDHYVDKYDIPTENILGLTLPSPVTYDNHVVILYRKGEIIKDTTSAWYDDEDTHAWEYYIDYIANPIKSRLDSVVIAGDTLKNTIRYIVLCYGIPYKLQTRRDWAGFLLQRDNICMDGLLTILYHPDILDLWLTSYNDTTYANPYHQVDTDYNFDMRFKSHHFINNSGLTLNYLVSRLDALDYNTVEDMIDKSTNPDLSGESTWILDGGNAGSSDMAAAYNELDDLEFDTEYNNSPSIWITTCANDVIAYTSAGTHQGMPSTYIQDTLDFDYANGSIFNTYESFNGNSIHTLTRKAGQGLLTEFFLTGGTAGAGHTWEPTTHTVIDDEFWFPAYAMGYSLVDATFQGMPYLAFQNVVVGDPLSPIAWGKQTLTKNITWKNTNILTDTVTIPSVKTLTIQNGSEINLEFYGFITGEGTLVVGSNVTFNITSWSRALFMAVDHDHPKLVWGAHPTMGEVDYYKIYRKFDSEAWAFLDSVDGYEYIDDDLTVNDPDLQLGTDVKYKITGFKAPSTESVYSNEVVVNVKEKKPKSRADQDQEATDKFSYELNYNYPNPFNPTTDIKYSINKAGLVSIKVYDILGIEIATLVNEKQQPGNYSVRFNASHLPSGIYIYRIISGSFSATKKMILLK